jgi:tetratricopeptide (TPR) repeat protein
MKNLIYLTSVIIYSVLNASSLDIIKFKENAGDVYHLSIKSDKRIVCSVDRDYQLENRIICDLNSKIEQNCSKNFKFFSLNIDNNRILIKPKYGYKIFYYEDDFFDKTKFNTSYNYNRVDIVFYKKLPSFLKKTVYEGLNFKIDFKYKEEFFIDVLNDNLTPVASLKDANKLDFINKLFSKKDYKSVIKKADQEFLNNIYSSEILLFKIRALDKILENKNETEYNYFDLRDSCDLFIDRFPSHKDLAEVFFYKIKSLANSGKKNEAITLINKVVESFPKDKFSEKALLIKAELLFKSKEGKELANNILKNLLYSTKNVKNALESAMLLINNYLKNSSVNNAKIYLSKILRYEDYILENKKKFYDFAKVFAKLKDYNDAMKIAFVLNKNNSNEELLKDLGFWQEKANLNDLAYETYKKYIKKYPDGRYNEFIKERMDKVLIHIKDKNSSKKIKDIDNILKKYSNEPIYKEALIQKAKLLIQEQKYDEVLNMLKELNDINETSYIKLSAEKLLYRYLDSGNCLESIEIVDKYKVRLDGKKLYKLGDCYYRSARYKKCLELSTKFIKSKEIDNGKNWYYLAIKSAYKIKNYNLAIKLYEDLIKLSNDKDIDTEVYYELFFANMDLKYINKALEIVKFIEDKDESHPKLLDVYFKLVKFYKARREDLMVVLYGKKMLKLQKKLKIKTYSPLVDIYLIKSLSNLHKYKEALEVFTDAYLNKSIDDSYKARLLYLAGELNIKKKNIKQAKEFFIKCKTDTKNELWQKLCSENLKLIEDK